MCEFFANYLEKHIAVFNKRKKKYYIITMSRYLLEMRYDNIARQ